MKKLLCLLCALLMLSGVTAVAEERADHPIFPLEEPITFDILVSTSKDVADLVKSPFYQELVERTNVHLNLINLGAGDDAKTVLSTRFYSREVGDGIWGATLIQESEYGELAEANVLASIRPYIEDPRIMPNFSKYVLSESPNTKAYITSPDGEIYALPRYTKNPGAYLESPICVNKAWLDALDIEVPVTIEEFKDMLIRFRDDDPNGNGLKDEIPYLFREGNAYQHLEALMGCWGLATKDNQLDNFVMVQDGKVVFVPTTDAYKAALTTFNDWYEEGLLWSEGFVANESTLAAKRSAKNPAIVGVYTAYGSAYSGLIEDENTTNEYIHILPPVVEGYDRCWYYHPGWQGIKGSFSLTAQCEHPEILMAYMDIFYNFEDGIKLYYGYEEDRQYSVDENGVYTFITIDTATEEYKAFRKERPFISDFVYSPQYARNQYSWENLINDRTAYNLALNDAYKMYSAAGILNDEIWPRPYFTADDSVRLSELRTDIFNIVTEKRAKWVTGVLDIDAEWDSYVEDLNKLGLDEFLSILQNAYDLYLEAL